MALPIARMELNVAQGMATLSKAKTVVLEWGRGAGKSFLLAWFVIMFSKLMPRGKFYLVGTSYKAMMADTLPSTKEALERLGWYEGVHFYVGRRGPDHWPAPYQAPARWDNYIHTFTGAAFTLISQDKGKVESRGHNFDGGIGDEVAQLDPKRLFNECHASTRTWRQEFQGCPYYLNKIYASSTPVTRAGQWFLKYEEVALARPSKYAFLRADARVNAHNLSPTWFKEMREEIQNQALYDAEIMNIRMNLTVNGFYPKLQDDPHYYRADDRDFWLGQIVDRRLMRDITDPSIGDMDYNKNAPLIISFDPGSDINVVVVMQVAEKEHELRSINCFWRKYPSIIQDLFLQDVLPYYAKHRRKVVDLFFDHSSDNRVANSKKTVLQEVVDMLRKAGWSVRTRSIPGRIITHDHKYHVITTALSERDKKLYKLRINRDKCRDLIISLENAEAIEKSNNKVRKDKRSEKRMGSTPRQHATDLSDAFDLPVYYYTLKMMKAGSSLGGAGFT